MIIHEAPSFRIYFGNADDALQPDEYLSLPSNIPMLEQPLFSHLKKRMKLEHLIFLKQTHSVDGLYVDDQILLMHRPFFQEGDFLTTSTADVGLGVMTADCLPLVFYDSQHAAIAIAHAGWRGSVDGIAVRTLEAMQQQYGTRLEYVRIFFGPSAKVCCYEVDESFIQNLDNVSFADQVLVGHGDAIHFDLPRFNRLLLQEMGIKKEAFLMQYNICTICHDEFFSYRRQGKRSGRQMTVVSLK